MADVTSPAAPAIRSENGADAMAHLASRYGWLAFVLGLASLGAIQRAMVRGYAWHTVTFVALWCTATAAVLHLAYADNDTGAFAKRADGTQPLFVRVLMLPFLAPFHLRQFILIRWAREPAFCPLLPGIWIGRRPIRPGDVPDGVNVVVDLVAECPSAAAVRRLPGIRLVSFPMLEAGVRAATDLRMCIDALPDSGLYLHCAQGHGRTGFFVCAFLLRRGFARSLQEAQEQLSRVRPRARLRAAQVDFLNRPDVLSALVRR